MLFPQGHRHLPPGVSEERSDEARGGEAGGGRAGGGGGQGGRQPGPQVGGGGPQQVPPGPGPPEDTVGGREASTDSTLSYQTGGQHNIQGGSLVSAPQGPLKNVVEI